MPNIQSAKKSQRQDKKRAVLNQARQDAFKEAIKKAVKAPTKEAALPFVRAAQKALDKAAKCGVIKKQAAARQLSRLMKKTRAV